MDKRIANGIAIVITAVWAISFLADIALTSYEPSPFIHAIMMVVAGSAFGIQLVKKNDSSTKQDF